MRVKRMDNIGIVMEDLDAAMFAVEDIDDTLARVGERGAKLVGDRMLETPPDEPPVQIQRVEHESRVHIDIETDDIPAEVARLEALGAEVVDRLERWVVMQAPTGQRFCVVRVQRPGFPKHATRWS